MLYNAESFYDDTNENYYNDYGDYEDDEYYEDQKHYGYNGKDLSYKDDGIDNYSAISNDYIIIIFFIFIQLFTLKMCASIYIYLKYLNYK